MVVDASVMVDGTLASDAQPTEPGGVRWILSLASVVNASVQDGADGLVLTGTMGGVPIDFGGGTLRPTGLDAWVTLGYDAETAAYRSSVLHNNGDAGRSSPFVHTVDPGGAPIINGWSAGDVDLGQGTVPGGGNGDDGFIGVYGAGVPRWLSRIVGGDARLVATALGADDTCYGAGWFAGSPTFNGATLTSAGGRDLFVARFSTSTGAVAFTRTFGGNGYDEISSAARSGDDLVLSGIFNDTLAFGGTAQPITATSGFEYWVSKLGPDGDGVWAVHYEGVGTFPTPHLAVDSAGDIYITGTFHGHIAFGSIDVFAHDASDGDIFVAKLRGSDGNAMWAVSLGSPPEGPFNPLHRFDRVNDIAVDNAGHLVVAANIDGPLDARQSAGGFDAVIASFDSATGATRWINVYSTPFDDTATAVTYGRNGDVYALVRFIGLFDFGHPIIGGVGGGGYTFLLRLAP